MASRTEGKWRRDESVAVIVVLCWAARPFCVCFAFITTKVPEAADA